MNNYQYLLKILFVTLLGFFLYGCLNEVPGESTTHNDSGEENQGEEGSAGEEEVLPIQFVAFGDQGSGNTNQQNVADAVADKCDLDGCDFVVTLGDNFYNDGVTGVDDQLFQVAFEIPYADIDVSFYPSVGNHDRAGNLQAQVDYSAFSEKWTMPALYYSHIHPQEDPAVEFFAINTENFDTEQANWLTDALDASEATWKILYGHRPYYSNGPHGDNENGIATASMSVICGKIDLILSGHDHDKEHLLGTTGACQFHTVILGSGGQDLYTVVPDSRTFFAVSSFGFGWFEVSEEEIYFEFIDTNGDVEYSYTLTK